MKNRLLKPNLSYPKVAAIGFAVLIMIGTFLLMLPISSRSGDVSLNDALFTATSAACITGLVPFDTFTTWTFFGQVVIICLIQIGGLGFISILAFLVKITRRRMSLKQKMLFKESIGLNSLGDVNKLIKSVLLFTLACEGVGALILSTRFIPLTDIKHGIFMSIFTSISAYCNAGFDLMGIIDPSSSLTTVNNDPVILLTLSALIVFGGLGFIVWEDIKICKFKPKQLTVHTKLTLVTTAILIVGGALFFLTFENNHTFKEMGIGTKLTNALFCSITPRTAGFNSVNISNMTAQSKMLTIMLMFIGGSTGSTAGGVKTTTIAILVLCVVSNMKNKEDINIFGRRVTLNILKSAISITLINFIEIFLGVIFLSLFQCNISLIDIIYECTSAMGTVGMTTGVTSMLNIPSQLVIIALMYIGRLTSIIFALSFINSKPKTSMHKPNGKIMVG